MYDLQELLIPNSVLQRLTGSSDEKLKDIQDYLRRATELPADDQMRLEKRLSELFALKRVSPEKILALVEDAERRFARTLPGFKGTRAALDDTSPRSLLDADEYGVAD